MKSFYIFNNRLLSHVLFWVGILFIYTFFPFIYNGYFFEILKTNLFFLPQDIIAVYFVLYVLFPKYLTQFKIIGFFIFLILAILFLTTISAIVTFYILPHFNLISPDISLKKQFSNSLFALLTITSLAASIKYIKLNLINQFKTADISLKQMETELKYLRSQINPHFLFNSLNNIDELVYENQEKASKAIFHLSEILRYVLKESEINQVEISKEIEFMNNYIDFVRYSFKDNNFIEYKTQGQFTDKKIPPLLFLPIIENAVKYVDRKAKSPGIIVRFNSKDDFFEFECKNCYSKHLNTKNQNGIGLRNLKRRLELIFPDKHSLVIQNQNQEFVVKLKIDGI